MGIWFLVAILLLLALYLTAVELSRPHVDGDRLRIDQFLTAVDDGRVRTARVLDADGIVIGSYERPDGVIARYNARYLRMEGQGSLVDTLVDAGVPTTIDQQDLKALVLPAVLILFPALIVVLVFAYFILSARARTGLFAVRSGARRIGSEHTRTTFAAVAGQEVAVAEMREVSEFLSAPRKFAALGVSMPKGVLLYGPPGCGKTLLARALAGETGAAFFSISGADFVELYVGVGAARVRDLFKEAREHAPAIVFIDELDTLARRRSSGAAAAASSDSEQEQALNQLLAEMDGFSPLDRILVVGATNRPDTLDPALLRPGRLDRSIGLELPDERGRHAILEVHARGKPLAGDVDLRAVAEAAVGLTGADLASVVNEAGLLATRAGQRQITRAHLEQALRRIVEAPERQRRLSMRDRTIGQRTLAEDRVTFADVAGVDAVVDELKEIRDYLSAPDRFAALGARIPRGYLLSGPPGCGKTLVARAVAGEANAVFISAAATAFVERLAGEGAARVRDLFAEARSVAPAILFIDEIDAIGGARGAAAGDDGERHQTLNQILIELDGFSQRAGVVVIAATNRPDTLDPALVRPGRFDRHITMDLPDVGARREILALHAAGKPLASDADLDALARLTRGMSGADLANVINEAALLAARRGATAVAARDLEEALERAELGIGGAARMSDEERRIVAYHEAGHGLVAMALPGGRVLHKISILPRGRSLGGAWLAEADERRMHSRALLLERMATLLAGRAAEELVFGDVTDGASGDLVVVTDIARRMVSELGMSRRVGPLHLDGGAAVSDETARVVDAEVRALVAEAERMAARVLDDSRGALDRLAGALLEHETLTLAQAEELVRGGPARA
ncbi:MAG TPA: AAA family ATPase [Solirubrobacteraceae bacterium]|nr:AAA family ATPase [Solirubrobacteraceae bacterium]